VRNEQFELCCEVLRRLDREGVLKTWQKTVRKLLGELPLAEELTAVLS